LLKTMSRERLIFRFQLSGRHKKRDMKSRLMIILARPMGKRSDIQGKRTNNTMRISEIR